MRLSSLGSKSVIVEIGPGFTTKIGIGLAKIQFSGNLYIIEPNKAALIYIENQYKELLPNAKIIPINKSICEAHIDLPKRIDAILMNHIIDDMILNASLDSSMRQSIFEQMRPEQSYSQIMINTWNYILDSPNLTLKLSQQVLLDLISFLKLIDPKIIAISQYHSWSLVENKLHAVNLLTDNLIIELKEHFGDMNLEIKNILKDHFQDSSHWIVVSKKDQNQKQYKSSHI